MTVFAYTRVSTTGQTVENQKLQISEAGFSVTEWYEDSGVSGSTEALQRPAFSAMVKKLTSGDTVVVWDMSRLGRNTASVILTIEHLVKLGVHLRIMQFGGLDVASSMGKFFMSVMAAAAELERSQLIDRVHAGLERAKSNGAVLGGSYKLTPDEMTRLIENKQKLSAVKLATEFDVSYASVMKYRKLYSTENDLLVYANNWASVNEAQAQYKEKLNG